MQNIFAFDIETVPDTEGGKRLHDLQGLSDDDVAKVMFNLRQQQTGGSSDFLKLHVQRVVAISVVLRTFDDDRLRVMTLEEPEALEEDIIKRFFAGITKLTPTLVTWNGSGFDLPVLHYRALRYGIACPRYWESGDNDHGFRFNNYLNRFHTRHTDLMDVLAGYQSRACVPLDEIAVLLGFPGKMGMSGSKVWEYFQQGEIKAIRDYCETDALNTYLVYLRYLLISGSYSVEKYQQECDMVQATLQAESAEKVHFREFLDAWQDI